MVRLRRWEKCVCFRQPFLGVSWLLNHEFAGGHRLSKAGQRRQNKSSKYLATLALQNELKFRCEWNKRVHSWLLEIRHRGEQLRSESDPKIECERVFGVLNHAAHLIASCGTTVEQLVGDETRAVLANECCKVIASIFGADLYRVYNYGGYHKK